MGLAEDLSGLVDEPLGRSKCSIGVVLSSLESVDRAALLDALADNAVRATSLARVLRTHGHRVAEQAVRRHRRQECRCPDESG